MFMLTLCNMTRTQVAINELVCPYVPIMLLVYKYDTQMAISELVV